MQLAALLRLHYWLTQVGCPTPAVMVSHGVGVVLVQMLGFCTLCQGAPVEVWSAWFAGGVPLLPFSLP